MLHLDTNVVVAYLRGNEDIAARLEAHLPDVAISSLVLAELLYGAQSSQRAAENLAHVRRLLQVVQVASFDEKSAESYSELRAALRQKGRPIGEIDVLIAAVALANKATLVTHNVKHFAIVEGLAIEDWISQSNAG